LSNKFLEQPQGAKARCLMKAPAQVFCRKIATLWLCLGVLLLVAGAALGQSKSQLEEQKRQKLQKIQEINKILGETTREKQVNLGQLNALKAKIAVKQELINNTRKELQLIDDGIRETEQVIVALENDLDNLKKEYARMIYNASKSSSTLNKMMFVFSSGNFNEALRRISYLKQYAKARRIQVEQIQKTKLALEEQNQKVVVQKREKAQVLQSFEEENKDFVRLIIEQDDLVKQLASKEKELRTEVNEEKKSLKELEMQLMAIIKEEIQKTSGSEKATKITLTPETELISTSFAKNRGALIWPVEAGFISEPFGIHKHPVLKNIDKNNPGVYIQTKQGEKIRSVFDGEVKGIFEMPGKGYAIVINHGEYFTTYTGLSEVSVSIGDKVKRKQALGEIATSKGVAEIQFCIVKNQTYLDPEKWLVKK
jgi:septal ring factor EnvC (AmiA/AmiB activator)